MVKCSQKMTYCVDIKAQFQLLYLLNVCKAYNRNIFLLNNDPTQTLHKQFLGFNLIYINIMDYKPKQLLNATQLTLEQLKKQSHKLSNYTVVNYDSLKEYIQQTDPNYP